MIHKAEEVPLDWAVMSFSAWIFGSPPGPLSSCSSSFPLYIMSNIISSPQFCLNHVINAELFRLSTCSHYARQLINLLHCRRCCHQVPYKTRLRIIQENVQDFILQSYRDISQVSDDLHTKHGQESNSLSSILYGHKTASVCGKKTPKYCRQKQLVYKLIYQCQY